jgi:hypothetical protein
MANVTKQRKRPPKDWESAVDRAIREAQERGEFDNLPGKGRPLRWDDEHVPPEWRMANRILKNSGFAPSWIEDDKWIRAERKAVRQLLDGFADWYREERAALAGKPQAQVSERLEELAVVRDRRIQVYRERAGKLNKRIDIFNLTVPIPRLQWRRVRVEEEIDRFRRTLEEELGGTQGNWGELRGN